MIPFYKTVFLTSSVVFFSFFGSSYASVYNENDAKNNCELATKKLFNEFDRRAEYGLIMDDPNKYIYILATGLTFKDLNSVDRELVDIVVSNIKGFTDVYVNKVENPSVPYSCESLNCFSKNGKELMTKLAGLECQFHIQMKYNLR